MEAQINIDLNNAAFGDSPEWELSRILTHLRDEIDELSYTVFDEVRETGSAKINIMDINGNSVGELKITE